MIGSVLKIFFVMLNAVKHLQINEENLLSKVSALAPASFSGCKSRPFCAEGILRESDRYLFGYLLGGCIE
jgi:hypothetical protein